MYEINIAIIYIYNEVKFLENLKLIWSLQSGISITCEAYIKFIKFPWFGICQTVEVINERWPKLSSHMKYGAM